MASLGSIVLPKSRETALFSLTADHQRKAKLGHAFHTTDFTKNRDKEYDPNNHMANISQKL